MEEKLLTMKEVKAELLAKHAPRTRIGLDDLLADFEFETTAMEIRYRTKLFQKPGDIAKAMGLSIQYVRNTQTRPLRQKLVVRLRRR